MIVLIVKYLTPKGFKGIKDIIYVKSTWRDYIWYIVGALILILLTTVVVIFFVISLLSPFPRQLSNAMGF